jgi:hypothetical protein
VSWWAAIPVLLVVLVVVLAPGAAALAALGVRGLPLLALAAPVTVAILGGAAIVLGLAGIGWAPWVVPVLMVVSVLVAVGIRRWRGVPHALRQPLPPGGNRRYLGGAIAAAAIGALPIAWGFQRLDRPPQTFDAVFHLNAVRYIQETGRASSLLLGTMNNPGRSHSFYPAGWHVIAGTVVDLIGADPAAVANAMTLVLAGLILPAGTALATQALMPTWRWSAAVGAVMGTVFAALPVLMASYGTLFPNVWATGCLPAILAATVLCLRHPGLISWITLLFAGVGLLLLHPSALFGFALLALPLLVQALLMRWRRLRASGRGRRAVADAVVLAAIALVGVVVVLGSSVFAAVRSYPRAPVETMAQAVGEALLDAPLSGIDFGVASASWLVAGLIVLGFAHAATVREQRPWVWSLALAVGAYAIAAGAPKGGFLRAVTGFWYNDPTRLAGQVPVIAAPMAAIGVWVVARWLGRFVEGSRVLSGGTLAARLVRVTGVPVLLIAALVLTGGGYAHKRAARIAFDYWPAPTAHTGELVTPAEESLLRDLPHLIPADATVLADPFNGGAWAYALGDRLVVFPHMTGTFPPDALALRSLMPNLADPRTCALLDEFKVRYLYVDSQLYLAGIFEQLPYTDLDEVPGSGVRLVRRAGTAALYRITACS